MRVIIKTPSRLHFCLIDMNGSLGRINGSLGLALNYPNFILEAIPSNDLKVIGNQTRLVKEAALNFYNKVKVDSKTRLSIKRVIPRHIGLGSTTQTLLGVGTALSHIHKLDLNAVRLAKIMSRGGTSGIGVYAHQFGGLILDGGHEAKITDRNELFVPSSVSNLPPPPVLFRDNFPREWKFVISIPNEKKGLHGLKEVNIFKERCPVPSEDVDRICRIILIKMLPALLEKNIEEFGSGLTSLQNLGFARTAHDLVHPTVKACMNFMLEKGAYGAGQSSFGPATYGLVEGEEEAKELSEKTKKFLNKFEGGTVFYSEANNSGVEVKLDDRNYKRKN